MNSPILNSLRTLDPARQSTLTSTPDDPELHAIMAAPRDPRLAPGPARRRPTPASRWVLAGAAAAAISTVAVWQFGGQASPAYAVEETPQGSVSFSLFDSSAADDLQTALADHGIDTDISVLPIGQMCAPDRYTVADTNPVHDVALNENNDVIATIPADLLDDGQTLVVEFWGLAQDAGPGETAAVKLEIANGPIATCTPVDQA